MIGPSSLTWAQQSTATADALAAPMGLVAYTPALVERRRRTYLAGRIAAAQALRAAGCNELHVGRAASGAPVWPGGWCGSISHDDDLAVAAVAPNAGLRAIGIDLQLPFSPESDSARAVRRYALHPDDADLSVPELFALKEAGYKCLSAIGVERGLHDLRVVQGSQLQLICNGHTLDCAIGALAARVLAVAWIGAESPGSHPR